jgi:P4 family phage/plasmid primase-like protien
MSKAPTYEVGVGVYFLTLNSLKTMKDTNEIFLYRDGVYVEAEKDIEAMLQKELVIRGLSPSRSIKAVLDYIKRERYINRSEFDKNPFKISCLNGIIDLKTGNLEPHTPDFLTVIQIPVIFDREAECPKTREFLFEVFDNGTSSETQKQVDGLFEALGDCLIKNHDRKKAFLLNGGGDNGKSTALEIPKLLLGSKNYSAVQLQKLDGRFYVAELYGKLANIAGDLPPTPIKDTSTFKMSTGGDPLLAEKKNKDPFKFINHAKHFFSANTIPTSYDITDAFYDRWLIFDFPNKFPKDEGKKQELLQTFEEELSGILNEAIKGLNRLQKNKAFSNAKSSMEIRHEYEIKSDSCSAFIEEGIEQDFKSKIPKNEAYSAYAQFCEENKMIPKSMKALTQTLHRKFGVGFGVGKDTFPGYSGQVPSYRGIKLKPFVIEHEKASDEGEAIDEAENFV